MRSRRLGIAVAIVLVSLSAASGSTAYTFRGVMWPGGVVPYFNDAPDQAWAVNQAVKAWNDSGAHVRFVAVPRAQAQLVIDDPADKVYCTEGHATVGYVRDAQVVIFPAHGLTHACNPFWAARIMAHELGHVLGLEHEDRYCATMNAYGSFQGGRECEPKLLWAWRCRLLEPDDVAGVVRMYGGSVRPVRPRPLCGVYDPMRKPGYISARQDASTGQVVISFTRPTEPVIPAFAVPVPWRTRDSFVVSAPAKRCSTLDPFSTEVFGLTHWRWHGAPGARETFVTPAVRGTNCYAVWAIDRLGRPSARATVQVTAK